MRRAALAALALLAFTAPSAHAGFPGNNGKIVFSSDRDEPNPGGGCHPDCNYELYTMNPDGSGVTRLTNTPEAEHYPAWSADGTKIAFTRSDSGSDIWVMNADGTDQVNLTPGFERGQDPAWSPDGTKIAFSNFADGVFVMDADGTDATPLFNMSPDGSSQPNWAPDGSRIALSNAASFDGEVWIVNPDGTSPELLATDDGFDDESPNWSPDSQRIAFLSDRDHPTSGPRVYVMDRDGTDQASVSPLIVSEGPVWSPDGSQFAFIDHVVGGATDIFTMATDGSGVTNLTNDAHGDLQPDWQPLPFPGTDADLLTTLDDAPDPVATGRLVTYTAAAKNLVGPAAATGVTMTIDLPPSFFFVSATPSQGSCSHSGGTVSCNFGAVPVGAQATVDVVAEPGSAGGFSVSASVSATEVDPIPANNTQTESTTVTLGGYARPKGADIVRAALVPAYHECSADEAGAVHGPPLEHPSCGSPTQTSGYLTVGTPDANGRPANFVGAVKMSALFEVPPLDPDNGDQNDVLIEVSATDVRLSGDLADYTGDLLLQPEVRITDRDHSPSFNAPGTVVDTVLGVTIPCAATASTTVGGTCSVQTTIEALVPGLVKERERTMWQLGRVRVFDGGADGDVDTGVNTLFATQGLFIP